MIFNVLEDDVLMRYLLLLAVATVLFVGQTALASSETSVKSCKVGVDCESGLGLAPEVIERHPEPNVKQVTPDQAIVFDRRYRRVNGAVSLHDAPNGNAAAWLDSGFNFVTLMTEQDGWAQVSHDRWIRSDALTMDVPTSTFSGVYLPEKPLPYPVAWVLVNVYPAKTPGGAHTEANALMRRYTMVYLYDTVDVDGWHWYQVGADAWVKQTQVARILPVERPEDVDTERWFSIDLYEQVLMAYEGETPVFATLISSGLEQWPTNEGLFHIYIRHARTLMSGAYGRPDFYYLQEVPWTMYFDNDIALHGAYWHDGFGYRRSHGCVNLSIMDAYLMYQWSTPEFTPGEPEDTGPAVYVYSSGDYR